MMRLVIKGGRVVDPATGVDGICNIYIMGNRIASIKPVDADSTELTASSDGLQIIDAAGMLVMPGLIDLHTHLREPGYEYKETIKTGGDAALAGGFTTVCCMANTKPVNDNATVTRYIVKQAESVGVNVLPIGALSIGQKGERLVEMADMLDAGCAAFSDDGSPVSDGAFFRRALEYSLSFGSTVVSHAEDLKIAGNGVMNEGTVSTRLGLKGIPNAAEDVMVARDISLAELTGARVHIAHVSTAGSVGLIRSAKARGMKNLTAEATPHHLTLTEEAVLQFDTNAKMNPPLRTQADVDALREGVKDGTIDCIATDHAPQSVIEKDVEFDHAANGIIGFETAFSLIYGLVVDGVFTVAQLVSAMSNNPGRAFGLDKGTLRVGGAADITIADLNGTWTVDPLNLKSKSKNTPYAGMTLKGVIVKTLVNGKVVYDRSGIKQ